MNKTISLILKILIFIVGVTMVVVFQKHIGYENLIGMVVGLGLLLSLLYMYNQKFK